MWQVVLAMLSTAVTGWECGVTAKWEKQLSEQVQTSRRLQQGTPFQRQEALGPIRIHAHYGDMFPLPAAVVAHIKKDLVPSVIDFYANTVSIHQLSQNWVLPEYGCFYQSIPIEHRTTGLQNVDLVLYISGTYAANETYVARAGACAFEEGNSTGSPIAGIVEINYANYENIGKDEEIDVIRHEIAHVLAFSYSLFYQYRQPNGTFYENPVVNATARGREVYQLATPKVLEKAKAAFDCSSLTGLELEDWGGSGTAGSHWEKRIMMNDFMTGAVLSNAIYSDITLAAFEDSGWYTVNYDYTDQITFGRKRGCDFFTKKCIENEVAQFPEFCDTEDRYMCGDFNTKKSRCGIFDWSSPREYQYFSDPQKAGGDPLADYCPFVQPYINGDCTGFAPGIYEYLNETACPTCRCFKSKIDNGFIELSNYAGCYNVTCNDGVAKAQIGEITVTCPFEGGSVNVSEGLTKVIHCPPYDQICIPPDYCPNGCSGFGKCVGGKCVCNEGYSGRTCSTLCAPSCRTCEGPGFYECGSCYENASLVNNTCACDIGFKLSNITKKCISCDETCLTCTGPESNQCLTCPIHATLTFGACVCEKGFARSADFTKCVPCHPTCGTCQDPTEVGCLTCKGDGALPRAKIVGPCLCGLGLFMKMDFTCASCHASCQRCSGAEATQCLSCYPGASLYDGSCSCTGYFDISGKCNVCSPNCLNCTDSASKCTDCDMSVSQLVDGACACLSNAFKADSGACIACHSSCKTCKGVSYASCTSCPAYAQLSASPGACLCGENFFFNSTATKCNRCDPSCSECRGPGSDACTKCIFPALLNSNFTCSCPDSYFPNPTAARCGKCHPTCQSCTAGDSNSCQDCFYPAALAGMAPSSCECPPGTVFGPDVGKCVVPTCHATCSSCDNKEASGCTSCWQNAMLNSTSPSTCECTRGFFPNPNSSKCVPCSPACSSCYGPSPFHCFTCSFGFNIINNFVCGRDCPNGQISERNPPTYEGICTNQKRLIFQLKLDSANSTLVDTVDQVVIEAKSVQESGPGPLSYYRQGRFFDGVSDYLSSEGSFRNVLLGPTHSMEFWIRPADKAPLGCLFSMHTVLDDLLLRFCITDSAALLLEFSATSLKDFSVTSSITLVKGQVVRTRKWVSVGYQLESKGKSGTSATLLIAGKPAVSMRYPDIVFRLADNQLVARFLAGATYTSYPYLKDFYTGYMAEMSIYNGLLPPANSTCACPTGFTCSSAGLCLSPCFGTEYQTGNSCSACGSECPYGCIKGSDCKVAESYLCANLTSGLSCPKCGDFAELTSYGDCRCVGNAVADKAGKCSCAKDFQAEDGICKLCLPYITPSEVSAAFDSTFLKVVISFVRPVVTKPVSKCEQIFYNSTIEKLGNGYSCKWDGNKKLTVTLGKAPAIISEALELNYFNLYSLQGSCSFIPEPLLPVAVFPGPLPTITVKLPTKPDYSLICATNDSLILDASGTTGLKNRPLSFTWTITSDPLLDTLSQYQNYTTTGPILIIPNSLLSDTKLGIGVTVRNSLGCSKSVSANVLVTGNSNIGLRVEKGTMVTKGTETIYSVVVKPAVFCTKISTITYIWTFIEAVPAQPGFSFPSVASNKLTLSSKALLKGVTYTFVIKGTSGQYSGMSKVAFSLENAFTNKREENGKGESHTDVIILGGKGWDKVEFDDFSRFSSAPIQIISILVIFGILSSVVFAVFDRKLALFEAKERLKSKADLESVQMEGAEMVQEKSSVEQISSPVGDKVPIIIKNVGFARVFWESHCVVGLFVHSSKLYRWMKAGILMSTLAVEMAVIGLRYANYTDIPSKYTSTDFLYCLSSLIAGLAVDLVLTALYTLANTGKSVHRKVKIAVSICVTVLFTCIAAVCTVYLAWDMQLETGSRWAVNFVPTLAGEVLVCQTVVGLIRAGTLSFIGE